MKIHTLQIRDDHLQVIAEALGNAPHKFAQPVFNALAAQLPKEEPQEEKPVTVIEQKG